MANVEIENPLNFDIDVEKYTVADFNHADVFNEKLKILINNEAYLRHKIEEETNPVGTIYENGLDPTNPAELFGFGTWERIGKGRVTVGVDEGDPDFDTVGKTGGEKEVQLTENHMPKHKHDVTGSTSQNGSHNHYAGSLDIGENGNHAHGNGTMKTETIEDHNHDIDEAGEHDHSGGTNTPSLTGYAQARGSNGWIDSAGGILSKSNNHRAPDGGGESGQGRRLNIDASHSHSLSINKSGDHSHNASLAGAHDHNVTGSTDYKGIHSHEISGRTSSSGSHEHDVEGTTDYAGNNEAHNNLQPHVTVYRWMRVA